MRLRTGAILIAAAFISLSSLAASAPRFHSGDPVIHGGTPTGEPASERVVIGNDCDCISAPLGHAKTDIFTGATGIPPPRLAVFAAGARVSRVSWNDTVRYPELLDRDVSTMLLRSHEHVHQSEGHEVARRPCSCGHTRDANYSGTLEAAPPTTQYEISVAEVASTSVQHPVPISAAYGVEPTVSAMASVAACGLGVTTTVFVTETVVITPIPQPLPSASTLQVLSKAIQAEGPISSSSGKPYSPNLPPSEIGGGVDLQTDSPSIVIIFETLTVIPLPALSERSFQRASNDVFPQFSSSDYAAIPSTDSIMATSTTAPLAVDRVNPSTASILPPPPIRFAPGSSVIVPVLVGTNLHGASSNEPSMQYIKVNSSAVPSLPTNLLTVGVNGAFSTDYGISLDTGVLDVNATTKNLLAKLDGTPRLSRDGGKGGYLNGQYLFVFCDTGSYTFTGEFVGFVSSSVATDKYMNGLFGKPLVLEDGIGQWSDKAGRLRGFVPMTTGEQAYNIVMQGKGQRYAVWPESSIIPLNQTHALMYAPIIYDNVNMKTQNATFTYTGNTLLVITAGGEGGPRAERIVEKLFGQDEVEWGVIGGLRSYGPSGVGGNDGKVYVFGRVKGGLLVGRVDVGKVTSRSSYEYWTGTDWSPQPPSASSSAAYAIHGAFRDGDIFYSPAHLTFLFIYLTPNADNTFYYRYLKAPSAILPSSTSDFAESIVKHEWSEEMVLYKAPAGPGGEYIYAGGVQIGYYGADDVSNGGKKILLSWTVPTGLKPGTTASEYSFMTAETFFA